MIEYSYHNERMSNFIVEKYENCVRNEYFPTNNRALHHVVVSYQIIHREHVENSMNSMYMNFKFQKKKFRFNFQHFHTPD